MQFKDIEPRLIKGYELKKAAGRPSVCRLELHVPDSEKDKWLGLAEIAVSDGAGEPLFFAPCREVSVFTSTMGASVRLLARLAPGLESRQRRFFQKPEKTFAQMIERIKIENCVIETDNELKNKKYEPLLLQTENDFVFLNRLATASGRKLWVLDNRQGAPGLAVKSCLDKSVKKFDFAKILALRKIRRGEEIFVELDSREYCELGRLASLEGVEGKLLPTELICLFENGRDIFRYRLETFQEEAPARGWEGVHILPGTIADAEDPDNLGRVRFAVDAEYAEDDAEKSWLPWLSPYTGAAAGMVFIPEKGDRAELVLSGGSANCRGALRAAELPEEARDAAQKYLGNNFKQRIIWKKDCLELRSEKTFIRLKANSLELNCQNTVLKIDESGITLDSSKDLQIRTKGEARGSSGGGIAISADKAISISASSSVAISGSKVELG